jgi:AraC-like DNA-binding protein
MRTNSSPQSFTSGQKRIGLGGKSSKEAIGCGFLKKLPGFDHLNYTPQCWSLSYVISGAGYININDVKHPVNKGDIFERRPYVTHSSFVLETDEPWWECFIDLGPELYQSLLSMGICRESAPVQTIGASHTLLSSFQQLNHSFQKYGESRWIELTSQTFDLALKTLSMAHQPKEQSDQMMIQTAEWELSQSLDQRFDLKQWCQSHQWDYDRFRRLFKESTGWSPSQYRIKKRIPQACLMMELNPKQKLAYFSEQLGYSTIYEFSNQFKTITGTSPGQYKKKLYH